MEDILNKKIPFNEVNEFKEEIENSLDTNSDNKDFYKHLQEIEKNNIEKLK